MARFLFVVPPLFGHVNPTVSVGDELVRRGHTVAWVGHPKVLRRCLAEHAVVFPLDDEIPTEILQDANQRGAVLRGAARLKFLWEEFFIPLARSMLPGVEAAIDAFKPDALIVDQQALAGSLAARKRGIAWATSATTSAGIVDSLVGLPHVARWLDDVIVGLQREAGVSPDPTADRSDRLVLAFTTRELVGSDFQFPPQVEFVGPSIVHRQERTPFPWDELADGKRRLLCSLGTVNAEIGQRFYTQVLEAFAGDPIQVVLVAPPDQVSSVPDNFIVRAFVPQLELMKHVDVVCCHAGHNTVVEALFHGLPLLLAPIKDDQPIVAEQVVSARAGIRVKFGRVRAPELRTCLYRLLEEPHYRVAAHRIQQSFMNAGGVQRAANLLEELP